MKKKTSPFIYVPSEKIIELIVAQLLNEKKGKLLDVGSGYGILCQKALELGFQAEACDLYPDQFRQKNIKIKRVDLTHKLPYQNNSFDYIVCTEVIEHLENPWHLLRELERILKKGGRLFISLPNFTSIASRLIFFTRGNFRYFDDHTWKNWGHINPITYMELNKILNVLNFQVLRIVTHEKINYQYTYILNFIRKTLSNILHLYRIVSARQDQYDKVYPLLETDTLMRGDNLLITVKKP